MATRGQTGAVYLKCEFKILNGKFQGQKIWSLIGLHSTKSDIYKHMGRVFMKEILESARGISPKDESEAANKKRSITSLGDLDNIVFVAEISIGTNQNGDDKNEIKRAITPDHQDYSKYMNSPSIDDQQNVSPF